MDFSAALLKIKQGHKVTRSGWNGKGMFLFLVKDSYVNCSLTGKEVTDCKLAPFVAIKTAQNNLIPWLASQADLLAEDWEVMDEQPCQTSDSVKSR